MADEPNNQDSQEQGPVSAEGAPLPEDGGAEQSAAESVSEPTAESTVEPTAESDGEVAADSGGEPAAESDAEPAADADVSVDGVDAESGEAVSEEPAADVLPADGAESAEPAGDGAGGSKVIGSLTPGAGTASVEDFEPASFGEDGGGGGEAGEIDLLDDVHLDVKIELGRTNMYIEDVLRLGAGSVVELDKLAGDPVDIYVNDRLIAYGEVLVLNDNFCVRINDIKSPIPELDIG